VKLVRPAELAKRLGCSQVSVWRWARDGHLPKPYRVGRQAVAFDLDEVETIIRARREGTAAADAWRQDSR
jgi:predicted DNA-binding transcriptional regulator AlpA